MCRTTCQQYLEALYANQFAGFRDKNLAFKLQCIVYYAILRRAITFSHCKSSQNNSYYSWHKQARV